MSEEQASEVAPLVNDDAVQAQQANEQPIFIRSTERPREVTLAHLSRAAKIYVRQSTEKQVEVNTGMLPLMRKRAFLDHRRECAVAGRTLRDFEVQPSRYRAGVPFRMCA